MEIKSVQGINAYAANTLDSERSQVESQNRASARSDISPQAAQSAQQAFEVNISREGQQLNAESGARENQQPPGQAGETETREADTAAQARVPGQAAAARQQPSQIVNIVA